MKSRESLLKSYACGMQIEVVENVFLLYGPGPNLDPQDEGNVE